MFLYPWNHEWANIWELTDSKAHSFNYNRSKNSSRNKVVGSETPPKFQYFLSSRTLFPSFSRCDREICRIHFFFALYSCAEHRAAHYPRVALAHIRFTHPLPARHNIIIGSRDRPHNGRSRVICADWYARGSTVECAPEKKLGPRRGGKSKRDD